MFHLYSTFRAKLAEWLASKGKALKKPAISEKPATFSRKPKPAPEPTGAQSDPEPTAPLKMNNQTNDIEVPDNKTVCSRSSSNIINTTLDLLDNCDMDLPIDPEIRMESVRTIRESYLWNRYIDRQREIRWCICHFFNRNFCFACM